MHRAERLRLHGVGRLRRWCVGVEGLACPKCGSLGIGERCFQCGAAMAKPVPAKPEPVAGSVGGTPAKRQAAIYLQLQQSEQAVLHAASRILAGFAANGALTSENENELCDRSVRLAARMAVVIERYVQSDDEDW